MNDGTQRQSKLTLLKLSQKTPSADRGSSVRVQEIARVTMNQSDCSILAHARALKGLPIKIEALEYLFYIHVGDNTA